MAFACAHLTPRSRLTASPLTLDGLCRIFPSWTFSFRRASDALLRDTVQELKCCLYKLSMSQYVLRRFLYSLPIPCQIFVHSSLCLAYVVGCNWINERTTPLTIGKGARYTAADGSMRKRDVGRDTGEQY